MSRGVWVAAEVAADAVGRLTALVEALPAGTVVSGLTAARLYGFWLPSKEDAGVEVTVPASAPTTPAETTPVQRSGVTARRRSLRSPDLAVLHGLPITSPARTWLDLARVLPLADLVAAGDSVLRAGTPLRDLREAVGAASGARGVRLARLALALLNGRSRSRPESCLRVALIRGGLPAPAVNVAVHDAHGGWLAEPDLSYGQAKLAIEYQGADHADPRQMRRDLARDLDLQRAGWQVLYYTSVQVFGHPGDIVADVRDALRQRADLG